MLGKAPIPEATGGVCGCALHWTSVEGRWLGHRGRPNLPQSKQNIHSSKLIDAEDCGFDRSECSSSEYRGVLLHCVMRHSAQHVVVCGVCQSISTINNR